MNKNIVNPKNIILVDKVNIAENNNYLLNYIDTIKKEKEIIQREKI